MGRKRNPNPHRPYRQHSNAPRCPVCGGRTWRNIHKKCEGLPHFFDARERKAAMDRDQQSQDAEYWDHPEAKEQRDLILAKYGERPDSIKDFWQR